MRCENCPLVRAVIVGVQDENEVWVRAYYCRLTHMVVDGYIERECKRVEGVTDGKAE